MIADEQANRMRDRRLRKRLLMMLHASRISPMGGLSGRRLRDLIDGAALPGQGLEDDDHALALLRDLVAKQYAEETCLRERRSQPHSLDLYFFRVTARGSSLLNETMPPDADIDDERNL